MKQDIEKGEERIPGRWNHFPVFDWGRSSFFSPFFGCLPEKNNATEFVRVYQPVQTILF
jgi:hypothetical protein